MKKISEKYRVGKLTKNFPAFVFTIFATIALKVSASTVSTIPDFAFPVSVEKESFADLKKALSEGNDIAALRSAIDICVARNLSSDDETASRNINLLDSLSGIFTGQSRSISFLLQAQILYQIYANNPTLYNSRKLPLGESFPNDPDEWSGEMFRYRIYALADSASSNISRFKDSDISVISSLLANYETAERHRMTVAQFIALKTASLLKNFETPALSGLIPFYSRDTSFSIEGDCLNLAKELLNRVISSLSKGNPVINAIARKEYLQLISSNAKEEYLKNSIEELKGTPGEGILLYELWNRFGQEQPLLYHDMCRWLDTYPDSYGNESLRHAVSLMSQKNISVTVPKVSLSGKEISGTATVSNLTEGFLLVYKLDNNQFTTYDELILKKFTGSGKPLKVIKIDGEGAIPFSYKRDITIPALSPGVYTIIPSETATLPKGWKKASSDATYSTFRVSDISLVTFMSGNENESGRVYVVEGENQQPVSGAIVTYYSGDSKKPKGTLKTDENGEVKIPNGYYRLEATKGKNIAKGEGGFSYYPDSFKKTFHTSILPDLGIYRPGDTIQFAVVGWIEEKYTDRILQNCKVDVELRDVNYIKVNSISLELNEQGRAWGKMEIPKGRLSGNYTLIANLPDLNGVGGSVSVSVEEYKLPAFLVTLEQRESLIPDVLEFEGKSLTYAGMPVGNGNVNIKVDYLPWRWGIQGASATFSETVSADSEGVFKVNLPLGNLKGTIYETGRYVITAEVTSQTGETEKSSPLYFNLGNSRQIRPSIKDKTQISGDSLKLSVPVYDISGLPVKTRVEYKITNPADSSFSLAGVFESPTLYINSSLIPSGRYNLEFKTGDEESVKTETIVWRTDDTRAPYPTPLWIPVTDYTYKTSDNHIKISFGSSWEDWILFVLSDGEKVLEKQWLSPQKNLQEIDVALSQGSEYLFVTLSGMHDLNAKTGLITIRPEKSLEKLEVSTVTFRENITAGTKEEWSFKFHIGKNNAPNINAFAVMTDKALNSIRDFGWDFNIWRSEIYSKVRINSPFTGNMFVYKNFGKPARYSGLKNPLPDWNTYGYSLIPGSGLRIENAMIRKTMATRNTLMNDEAADFVMEESAMETQAGGYAANNSESSTDAIELRPVEMPVAFFMPDLKSDSEGDLLLRFEVPDFNTTWQFQLAGYNDEMLNAKLKFDTKAAKPVMVKSNLPGFLRTGDKAEISASLYNNTDSIGLLGGKIEILDAISGEIIVSQQFLPKEVDPMGNRVISLLFDVENNHSLIAVRSYAFTENHTDGEQGFVPILPGAVPVVESTPFYITASQETIELKIPSLKKNSNVTLKYCDNPVWEVLLSLPSLTKETNASAPALSKWIYATLTASDIIRKNSNIATGISKILESEDTTLTLSNLQKNMEFKIAALNATPWVNNAANETERIRNLGKYLDSEEVDNQVKLKTDALEKLQNKDGGFSWFEGMKSSPFITLQIIRDLGYLKSIGVLEKEPESLARRAVKYYDAYIEELWSKNKTPLITLTMDYLYSRNKLGFESSKNLKKIEKECLDSIVAQWRYWNIGDKTKGALVLNSDMAYEKEVLTIMESLKETWGKHHTLYQEALMLELFEKEKPKSEFTEKIKETIFMQKETMDWGEDPGLITLIHALTINLPADIIKREKPSIRIGDKELNLSESQALIGDYTINLNPREVSGKKLRIVRNSGIAGWGGILRQSFAPVKDVKNVKVNNLAIEKNIYQDSGDGKVKEVSKFKKGDKVTVSLKLTCTRDMEYIVVKDSRSACLQPEDRISSLTNVDGLIAYKENGESATSFFIENLPAGKYVISYDCYVEREGEYSCGIAEAQCLYSPIEIAHSAGAILKSTRSTS